MGHIPGRKKERFYEKKHVVELIAVLPPLVTAAVGALVNLADPAKRTLGWWLAGATAWLALASVIKVLHAHAQDRERKRMEEHSGLRGALWVLYETLRNAAGLDKVGDGTLRVTIHRVVPPNKKSASAELLEQVLPYIGGKGGPPDRTFSVRSGVIGKAARERVAITASRQAEEYQDFLKQLVGDWSYTEEEARTLSPDRRSWMGVPILSAGTTAIAVVYLDSSVQDFFSAEIQQLIVNACGGIAAYTMEAY
jgi:GAF domain-containing protein